MAYNPLECCGNIIFFRLFHAVQDIFEKKVIFIDDYRLQQEVLHLQAGGEPLECEGGVSS